MVNALGACVDAQGSAAPLVAFLTLVVDADLGRLLVPLRVDRSFSLFDRLGKWTPIVIEAGK